MGIPIRQNEYIQYLASSPRIIWAGPLYRQFRI
jgi:hypothetical protein